ncbi:dockerin type I repeat protein [Anaerobacterium chartisolvens]|uniref:Dockerin type I repeat protein n=1 Tax=Anaerobacterium chartisolvens TaxID=1297424 RepID=A0A369ALA3_9FIRM|nr:glycoside hydrolase family 9 protein [Anaerobacterium chartisolvens]RCX09108.1 dockerin type I repeat protein [Anaerobacterium chartisolvens]
MGIKRFVRKTIAVVTAAALLSPLLASSAYAGPTVPPFNYAEALQKSLYFYDANKCGPGITGGRLEWRGDCHVEDTEVPLKPMGEEFVGLNLSREEIEKYRAVLDPDGNGSLDLHGGFHDAGDHVKFGLPQSYTISTLGWGFYEFRDSFKQINEEEHMIDILKWGNDYLLRSTFMNDRGEVQAFCYQVGEGNIDHNWWQPPELNEKAKVQRPAYLATAERPASDQAAGAAASLAINYLNFKEKEPVYAATCLKTAKALYEFAVKYRGCGYSGGFYNSSYEEDELSWAAVWLNIATGEESYIEDIISVSANGMYTGFLGRIISSTENGWQNIWVHSWDTVWGGVFAKLAPITNTERDWYIFRWNIEYWSGIQHENPNDTTFLASTPGGFRVLNTWGSARYNAAAQLCALVYNKYQPRKDFTDWAKDQMDYILGDNPMKRSYEVGYSDISAKHPHHRAAHGSKALSMLNPLEHRHTLWGALVGGPDGTDKHVDETTDFVYNEVAIDYNAGFVGALAGIYESYGQGQEPLKDFPPKEEDFLEFYSEAKLEQENAERTQITINIHNESGKPPHFEDKLQARYFFNISEMIEAGQSIEDLKIEIMYDESKIVDGKGVTIKGPFAWNEAEGVYYVELDWTGNSIYGDREFHFALVPKMDASWLTHWDPSDDWSRKGIIKEYSITQNIPVYRDGVKIFGSEPEGEVQSEKGDLNGDGKVDSIDYSLLRRYILELDSDINIEAADLNSDGNVNSADLAMLKRVLLGM